MSVPTSEIQSLTPGTMVTLYELDATVLGDTIHRFHAGVNGLGSDVVWQGETYYRMPIQASGFEISSKGVLPRPKVQVAAIDGAMGILVRGFDDLVGARFTRKRTLAKFLDAVNFAPSTATLEPFVPSGFAGQLSIGGVDVTADVSVSALTRTDWQGVQALSASARTNLCPGSSVIGGANWKNTNLTLGATTTGPDGSTVAALTPSSALKAFAKSGAMAVSAGTVYPLYVFIKAGTSPLTRISIFDALVTNTIARLVATWTGGVPTITVQYGTVTGLLTESMGGGWYRVSFGFDTGIYTSIHTLVYPDETPGTGTVYAWGIMVGAAGSYIPTTTTPVTVTDYAATTAGVVTLGETASGTYTWTGSGKLNATADPTAAFSDDVFYVERKVYEGPDYLEFELVSALDLEGLLLPRRKFVRNVCTWDDAAICTYSVGGLCPKTKVGCESRWGLNQPLPFSGFLGIGAT